MPVFSLYHSQLCINNCSMPSPPVVVFWIFVRFFSVVCLEKSVVCLEKSFLLASWKIWLSWRFPCSSNLKMVALISTVALFLILLLLHIVTLFLWRMLCLVLSVFNFFLCAHFYKTVETFFFDLMCVNIHSYGCGGMVWWQHDG